MTTLATMVASLQSDVPAENGVPSNSQYERCIQDAIADFSRRCGLTKIGTLTIAAGTASYSLAADFLKMIKLMAFHYSGTLITDNGLIPVTTDFMEEKFTVVNKTITFYPTPNYSMLRDYEYKAAWLATDGDYTTLGDDEVSVVMLLAQSLALGKQVNASSGKTLKYSFGAVSVDKGSKVEDRKATSKDFEGQYLAAVDAYNGNVLLYGDC